MDKPAEYVPPEAQNSDKALAVARALTGSIPVVGNAINELMPLLFTAPLEKRRYEWMKQIADALRELEMNRGITLKQLQSNEGLISVLVQATQVAIRNHQQEKLEALRHAVSNSASGVKIEEDWQLLFIRFIDELTPSHFALLRFFRDKEVEFEKAKSYQQLFHAYCAEGQLKITQDEFRLICEELKGRSLLRISPNVEDFSGLGLNDYIVTEGQSPGPMLLVTEIGRKLLDYVAYSGQKSGEEEAGARVSS